MSLVWIWGQRCPAYDLFGVGNPRVPLGLFSSNYSTLLWGVKQRNHSPSLPPTTLRVVIPAKSLLVPKATPNNPSNYVYIGWCIFLIKDCRYSSDFTPQNTSELQQILSAGHISHNSPCLHVKWQDSEDPAHLTRGLSRMVGSSEVTLSPLNFMYIYV